MVLLSRYFRIHFTSSLQRYTHTSSRMAFIPLNNAEVEPVRAPSEFRVHLTETEESLCSMLDKCRDYLLAEKGISTSCRIAGGWVRDKLLGLQSNDIDVALSDIMGLNFAEHLADFARKQDVTVGTISKIAQNPDQSKHLETATLKLLGLQLDLVNLRSEEYASNSRIPTGVTFGTPVQDALRRDITINALFYNVHTRAVEDFTERGLDDLRNGVIRTPLPPKETFLDDPLRIIRCVRFASRFGFHLVPELEEAVKDPQIREALVSKVPRERAGTESTKMKVARERVGTELTKMMKGWDPLHAVTLIHELSLYDPIFSVIPSDVTSTFSQPPAPQINSLKAASVLKLLLSGDSSGRLPQLHPLLLTAVKEDPACTDRLFLAAMLTPYLGVHYKDKKNKEFPAVSYVIRESLKLGTQNHYLDGIPALFAASELLKNPDLNDEKFKTSASERVAIGLLLREKVVHNPVTGSHWTSSLLFSLVQELVKQCTTIEKGLDAAAASDKIKLFNQFVQRVDDLGLTTSVEAKPLLSGQKVVNMLNPKPGPWTGQVLARVIEWQLEHPEGTEGECAAWLKDQHSSGKLNIIGPGEPANKKARTK